MRVRKQHSKTKRAIRYIVLIALSLLMMFPLAWMVVSGFKSNTDIMLSMSLLPKEWIAENWSNGWNGAGAGTGFGRYMLNSLIVTLPTSILSVLSAIVTAYGFSKFNFKGKKLLFTLLISTMLIPDFCMVVPRFMLYRSFGWYNTYYVFWVPALLAMRTMNVYMMQTMMRSLPRELDEAARLDGCSSFGLLTRVIAPLCKAPAITVFLLTFRGTWNDFFTPLIYLSKRSLYTVSLALRQLSDRALTPYGELLAMSAVSMLPMLILFFIGQRYFVGASATTGIKG